nr:hypothetical protein [Clostridiales bacterium]
DSADAIVTSDHITISVASSALKVTLSADKTTVSYGGSAKITASVTGGAAPYTYSWYKYNSANSTWVNQGSGSGGTCTASNVTQTTYIRCEVRDSAGSVVTSEHITISVGISGFTGTLKAEKSSVAYGGSTKLIATASGGVSPYMYNWYSYNPSTGKWVGQGMTSAGTFYLNNLTSGVTMRCEISDAKGNKTTTNEVTVGVADSFRASASADKKSVPYGGSATVTVSVTGGVSPYIYLWYAYINGQWVNLGTTPRNTYQLTNLTSNATVRCEVGDSRGNKVTTNDVTVTVTASRFSAALSSNAQSVQYGGSAAMTVSVSGGTAPYLYRWYTQRGSYGWADEGYSTSNIFTLYMITEDTQVRCEVIDFLGGSAVSNTVKITCASSAPTPTPTPTPGHEGNVMILADKYQISAGGAVNFTVSADFTPAYYTWFMQYDGEGIFYNVGTTTYNTYSARLTSDVRVYCIVTGANGATAQSNYIDIIVK